jgi:hypothetical protein
MESTQRASRACTENMKPQILASSVPFTYEYTKRAGAKIIAALSFGKNVQ